MKKLLPIIISSIITCGMLILPPAIQAQTTWYVDDDAPSDPGPGDPSVSDPLEDGSAGHPFDAIQEGINAASHGDTVLVADGTYTGGGNRDIDFNGKAIIVRSGNGAEYCIIDCQASDVNPHRGFYFHSGEGGDSVVQGFTIQNGYANGSSSEEKCGGAIHCYSSSPTIDNNIISSNWCLGGNSDGGGGLFCYDSFSIISNNIFSSNGVATGWSNGGGIFCVDSYPIISQNTLSGNHVYMGDGGGIRCSGGYATITDCTITGNTIVEGSGGGLSCESATISHCTVTGNWAGYWNGGGIDCGSGEIIDCTITGNSCDNAGGGIASGSCLIDGCLISGNSACNYDWYEGIGGGVCCISATIRNCTISNNTAFISGGGVYCGSATIRNCIISDNVTYNSGGGIHCRYSSPEIKHNIIISNTAWGGFAPDPTKGNGGGINLDACSSAAITNNIITGNIAEATTSNPDGGNGGAISLISCSASNIINNTITGNTAGSDSYPAKGGGIYCWNSSSIETKNTILWNNSAATGKEIYIGSSPSTLTVGYSNVEAGQTSVYVDAGCTLNWGNGMINKNPCFVTGPGGDYYLLQPVSAGLSLISPCVDSGDPLSEMLHGTTRMDMVQDTGTIDMGFHYRPCIPFGHMLEEK